MFMDQGELVVHGTWLNFGSFEDDGETYNYMTYLSSKPQVTILDSNSLTHSDSDREGDPASWFFDRALALVAAAADWLRNLIDANIERIAALACVNI